MEQIEIIREPDNGRELGVLYQDQQETKMRGFGDTIPEALENLADIMRYSDFFDHTETESF